VRGLLQQLCNDILSVVVARAGSSTGTIIIVQRYYSGASLSFFSRLMTDGARGVVVVVSAEDDGTGRIIYHCAAAGVRRPPRQLIERAAPVFCPLLDRGCDNIIILRENNKILPYADIERYVFVYNTFTQPCPRILMYRLRIGVGI